MRHFIFGCTLIISTMAWAEAPPKNLISMESARNVAAQAQSGKVKEQELQHDNGRWVYSFDIVSKDNVMHEVIVDAKSGQIISQMVDNPTEDK